MNKGTILLLGADGFIGRHFAYEFRALGYNPICVARRPQRLEQMGFETLAVDLINTTCHQPEFWTNALEQVDFVVNCAGLLNGSDHAFDAVHVTAPTALYRAFPNAPTVLISAVGIEAATPFATFRRKGEDALINTANNPTVLRCGLVLAATSYGGSSMIRALAACPWRIPLIKDGSQQFNPVHATDLARLVIEALTKPTPNTPIEVGGPETLTLSELLTRYRRWLGLNDAKVLRMPAFLTKIIGIVGDFMRLGPISTTAITQLNSNVLAKTEQLAPFETSLRPASEFIQSQPAATQDLWHARMYLMKPIVRVSLIVLWVLSGLVGLFAPPADFLPYFAHLGMPDWVFTLLARGFGVVDLGIAWALIRGWRLREMAWIQIGIVLGYTVIIGILAPQLWADPIGGMIKNIPILALLLVHLILEEER